LAGTIRLLGAEELLLLREFRLMGFLLRVSIELPKVEVLADDLFVCFSHRHGKERGLE